MNSNNINNLDDPVGPRRGYKAHVDAKLTKDNTDEITKFNNLYFTNERVDDRVGAIIGSGNISVTYDDPAGTITIAEALTTTDIAEGDNPNATTARARGATCN